MSKTPAKHNLIRDCEHLSVPAIIEFLHTKKHRKTGEIYTDMQVWRSARSALSRLNARYLDGLEDAEYFHHEKDRWEEVVEKTKEEAHA